MVVVGRQPEVGVLVRGPGPGVPRPDPLPIDVVGHPARDVRVDDVGERGDEDAGRRLRPASRRAHEERDHVLDTAARQPRGVDAAPEVGGHLEGEVRLPAAVVEVVVVEVDGGVVLRRVAPAHLLASPARALHSPRGDVHQLSMQTVRPHVHDALARGLAGEIPGRHRACGRSGGRQRVHLGPVERVTQEERRLDLPVEVGGRGPAPQRGDEERGAGVEPRRLDHDRGLPRVVDSERWRQRMLADREPSGRPVVGGPHAVPFSLVQPLARADLRALAGAVADGGAHAALIQEQGEAGLPVGLVLGQDALAAGAGQGRPDRRDQGEAPETPQRRGVGHPSVRAERHPLDPGTVATGEGRRDRQLLDPGPGRVGIGRDHSHQARLVRIGEGARHLERDGRERGLDPRRA